MFEPLILKLFTLLQVADWWGSHNEVRCYLNDWKRVCPQIFDILAIEKKSYLDVLFLRESFEKWTCIVIYLTKNLVNSEGATTGQVLYKSQKQWCSTHPNDTRNSSHVTCSTLSEKRFRTYFIGASFFRISWPAFDLLLKILWLIQNVRKTLTEIYGMHVPEEK